MKINKYILILVAALAFNACDDFLDITPKGKAVIETAEDFSGLLETMWPTYDPSDFAFIPVEQMHPESLQVLDYTTPEISYGFLWDEEFDRAAYNTIDPLYNECYKRIAKFNIVLDGIDASKGEEELKTRAKAQARILRAYNYFFLVNTYAKAYDPATAASDRAIVIRKGFDMETVPAQSTVQEVYDFIQQDIETALAGLPKDRENVYRPGKAFGYAFKAKVHLYKGELKEALAASIKATEFDAQLWSFEELFPNMMTNVPIDLQECLLHGYNYGMVSSPSYIVPEVMELFDPMDLRKKAFITPPYNPSAPAESGYFNAPWTVKWNSSGMRFSEVYLIMAECYARLGKVQDAVDTINYLRKFRFAASDPGDVTATTEAEARQIVIDERRLELMLTVNTFFDMKRYTVIPEYSKTLTKTFEGKEYTLEPDSPLYIMPFSVEAMEGNPNLKQNI